MCTLCQLAKQLLNENTLQMLVIFMDYIDMQYVLVHMAFVQRKRLMVIA